jgi:small conductance mechanosensitive channel
MDLGNLFDPQQLNDYVSDLILKQGGNLVLAVVILLAGNFFIKWAVKLVKGVFEKAGFEASLKTFLSSLIRFALYVVLFITVLGVVGVPMTSFLTILGAAGLAVGLALQGSLSNFAGGVLILAFRPFKVNDVIEAQGQIGVVERIDILHTHLRTADNRLIIMPNGALANSNVINITKKETRRVELPVGIAYKSDIKKAREVILNVVCADERVLAEPAPVVVLKELADSSLNLGVRYWVNTPDFWPSSFDLLEAIKEALDQNEIEIPFPQRDVYLKKTE